MIEYTVRIGEFRYRTFDDFAKADNLCKSLKPFVTDVHILAEGRKKYAEIRDHRYTTNAQ